MSNPPSPRDPEESVADPTTSAGDLRLIAYYRPELRARVAAHPNAYPGLLDWLDALGDPEVSAAVAARRGADMPPEPAAIDEGEAHAPSSGVDEPEASDGSAFAPTASEEDSAASDAAQAGADLESSGADVDAAASGEETDAESAESESPAPLPEDDDLEATQESPAIEAPSEEGAAPSSSGDEEAATAVLPAASATAEIPRVEGAPSGPVQRTSIFPAGTSPAFDDAPGSGAVWDEPIPAQNPWAPEAASAQPTQAAGWPTRTPEDRDSSTPSASPSATPTGWAPTGAGAVGGAPAQWTGAVSEEDEEPRRGIPVPLAVLAAIALVLLLVVGWLVTNGFGTRTPTTSGSDSSTATGSDSSTGSADSAASSAQSSTDAAQSEAAEPAYPAPAGAVDMAQFTAPSGNIACVLETDSVTCQIYETRWAGTSFDTCGGRSYGVLVATAVTAENSCAQGDVGDVRDALPYGSYATHGDYACASTADGISCWNTMTGKSFALARGGWMVGDAGEIAPNAFTW